MLRRVIVGLFAITAIALTSSTRAPADSGRAGEWRAGLIAWGGLLPYTNYPNEAYRPPAADDGSGVAQPSRPRRDEPARRRQSHTG